MSIIGHGIDLVECSRIEKVWLNHEQRFLNRILTPAEQRRCEAFKNKLPFIAGRWAAKEAILKMIGTGWRGQISWTDMEILPDELGAPVAALSGATRSRADQLGITQVLLSISHTEYYAVASAIGTDG